MTANSAHIAIVRLSALGDVAMTVPLVKTLRATYPDLKITVVSKPFHGAIFEAIANVDFLAAEVNGRHRGVLGLHRLSLEIKARGVTHLADCHNVLRSKILRAFFKFKKVELAVIDKGRSQKNALCNPNRKEFKALKSSHQRYADTMAKLGFSVNLDDFTPLARQTMPAAVVEKLSGWSGKLLGIAPFAAFDSKSYSVAQMRQVLELLESKANLRIFLFGGPNEASALVELAKGLPGVFVIAGVLKFKEELALISNLDAMLAMDSGNGHLAANYGIPVLTLWGVTHPFLGFAPFGQSDDNWLLPDREEFPAIPTSVYGKSYPNGYQNAINSIPPEQIVELIYNRV